LAALSFLDGVGGRAMGLARKFITAVRAAGALEDTVAHPMIGAPIQMTRAVNP